MVSRVEKFVKPKKATICANLSDFAAMLQASQRCLAGVVGSSVSQGFGGWEKSCCCVLSCQGEREKSGVGC